MNRSYFDDLVRGGAQARKLYQANFLDPKGRIERVKLAAERPLLPLVLSELQTLNSGRSAACDKNLELLSQRNVAVVVTGQQLGLAGGPLLTLYKALSAVKWAALLSAESGVPCVPIFWMQSEDHDFAEINKLTFFEQGESLKDLALDADTLKTGDCVGRVVLTGAALMPLFDWLEKQSPADPEIVNLVRDCYKPGASMAQAFSSLMLGLLASTGLLFFNPDSAAIKSVFKELIVTGFLRAHSIESLLHARVEELRAEGYQIQVPLRERSPLWFVSVNGARERVVEDDAGNFSAKSFSFSKDQLYQLIDLEPQAFSSSALVRPIFQDTVFPSAGYVAGAAEISYWAQITPLYPFFGTPQPLVLPRARFALLEAKYSSMYKKLDLNLDALGLDAVSFINARLASSQLGSEAVFGAALAGIAQHMAALEEPLGKVDTNLIKPLRQTASSFGDSLKRLQGKYERALAERESIVTKQFERVKAVVQPNENDQEREVSMLYYLLRHGHALVQRLLQEIEPLSSFRLSMFGLD